MKNIVIAKNIKDAVAKNKSGALYFAGGTEIERLNSSVESSSFVSLKNCELAEVSTTEIDGKKYLKFGALITFTDALENKECPEYLKKALRYCISLQKRNVATIAGNIASLRDDSYLVPTLIAAGAKVYLYGYKKSPIDILEYCSLAQIQRQNLLINAVAVPLDVKVESYRYAITESSHSTLNIAAFKNDNGNLIIAAAVKTYGILRLYDVENYLNGKDYKNFSEDDWNELSNFVTNSAILDVKNDLIYGSSKYKKYLVYAGLRTILEKM